MNAEDAKERRIAWAMLAICPLLMMMEFVYVTMGYAHGLEAGHPMEYLQTTCVLWALISMVLPALRILRLAALPSWFVILVYGDMCLFVVSLCQGMYFEMLWWPDFTHVVSSAVVGSLAFLALCLMQARSPPHVSLGSRGGIAVITVVAAMSFGAIWEIMEGFTDIITQVDYMSYGAQHTISNFNADMLGAILMGAAAWVILGRHDALCVASKVRLGRKNVDVDR
ncbi:MAG: hypothetical protein LBB30_00780 [Candidatus Methanoplasma sp.]|jgi:hypothetical protein|nr:hypothetical protein [Candidatus Methanoplasma sp.]